MEPVIALFEKLGVPVGLLVFLCYAIWKAGQWAAPLVAKIADATAENAGNLKLMEVTSDGRHKEVVGMLEEALRLLRSEDGGPK